MNSLNFKRWLAAFVVAVAICLLILSNLCRSSAQTENASNPQPNLTFAVIYRQTNLVSDLPGVALTEDPLLVNPWGMANPSTSPFWIANNVRPFVTIYKGDVSGSPLVKNSNPQAVIVNPPSPSSSPLPTAIVNNATSDFVVSLTPTSPAAPAQFIFASEAGTISAWQSVFGSASVIARTVPGHRYTGLAIGSNSSGNLLYAADFFNGKIDVFDKDFNLTTVTGGFVDVSVPASYHPFNIQNLGGSLYVTYAEFNQFSNRPNSGLGRGYVRKFDTDGVRDSSFAISGGVLDAPWGMVIAPAGSGPLSGNLIVGNFGSSGPFEPSLSAFNPSTGALMASMTDSSGPYLKIDKLWALVFGNGANGGDSKTLYFTAGIFDEKHGLLGSLTPIISSPPPQIKFSNTDYFVSENGGHIDITVTLSGIFGTPISVNYATVNGGAIQGVDYEMALGKLTFQPGETTKTFRVLIIDNHQFAGGSTRSLNLVLSNPVGAGADLVSPRNARLAIQDDEGDTPGSPPNTSDDPQLFVRQQYFDFLNREPDASGFNFWLNNITSCGSDQHCIEVKRINVSAAFFLSIEFQNTGMLAYLTHQVAGELPRYGEFIREVQQLQRNYVFGAPGAEAQLEANKQEFFNDFVERPEFKSKFGTNTLDVSTLLQNAGIATTVGNVYITRLTGNQQVPPNGSPAKGVAILRFPITGASPNAFVSLYFNGLTSPETAAHIHGPAAAGSEAPVMFSLPNDQVANFPITLTVPQNNALGNGKLYVDVHTANFPGGEIRGQLPSTMFIIDMLSQKLNDGTITRAQALRIIVESKLVSADEFNRAFVLMQYFGYLRRNPDDLPDHDFSGYNFWLDKLNAFNGDFVASEMVKAFLTSTEYRSRFGPP